MNTSTINIKVDPKTKAQIQEFAAEVGIPVSAILNAQIKQILRSRSISLNAPVEPTAHLQKRIKKAEADFAAGSNVTAIDTDGELEDFLNAL